MTPPVRSRGHARVRDSDGMGIRNCIAFCEALSDGRPLDLNYSKFLLLGVERKGMLVIRGGGCMIVIHLRSLFLHLQAREHPDCNRATEKSAISRRTETWHTLCIYKKNEGDTE